MDKEAVIAFFIGSALGAIGAGVWAGKRFEKALKENDAEWEKYVDSLVDEMSNRCEACQVQHEEEIVDDEDINIDDYEKDTLVEYLNTMATSDDLRDENGVVHYDKVRKKSTPDEVKTENAEVTEEDNEDSERVQDDYLEEEDVEEEYVIRDISEEEYNESCEEYDKMELTYLEGSDIFLAEGNAKYNAYPAIGGRSGFESSLEESPNGVVYIRNEALEMDFMIMSDIRDYDTYMEETSSK